MEFGPPVGASGWS